MIDGLETGIKIEHKGCSKRSVHKVNVSFGATKRGLEIVTGNEDKVAMIAWLYAIELQREGYNGRFADYAKELCGLDYIVVRIGTPHE